MSEKPRILILGKLPPPYMGPAIATQILLQSGLKDYFELIHLNTKMNASLENMGKLGIRKIMKGILLYWNMLWICLTARPHLVLIPISQSSRGFVKDFLFIAAGKLAGRRVVLQLRGSNFQNWMDTAPSFIRALVKFAMKWSVGMIVLGSNLRYLFRNYFPEERIYVIPNGGNFHFPAVEKNSRETRFLFFSNLFDAKGIRDVVDAVQLLQKEHPGAIHLDVAGSWLEENTRSYCMDLVEKNKLPVTFFPALSGVEKELRFARADVFIFTPRDPEGHPWVIVEAMAAALPVIATDKGAITESVVDGENGFIVKDNDPAAIAAKMFTLATEPALRKRMSSRSLEYYHSKFTEEKMVENYVKCFQDLLKAYQNG